MNIIIETFICGLGMFMIEFPTCTDINIIPIIGVTLCYPILSYCVFYNKKSKIEIKIYERKVVISILMIAIIFRICMNYIYNNLIYTGDNYAIYSSLLFVLLYNISRKIQLCVFLYIKKKH